MDRLDYLSRDSFFTGVSEGVIGYERILKMLTVHDNELVVEEKGMNSVEKFLMSRRLMYWQVYCHKTVVASENMLVKIIERAQLLFKQNPDSIKTGSVLDHFLGDFSGQIKDIQLDAFCQLDDTDVLFAVKKWQQHSDVILSLLCNRLLNRNCYKCQIQNEPISDAQWEKAYQATQKEFAFDEDAMKYLCFKGTVTNTMYKNNQESIKILLKSGEITNISQIQNALIVESLSAQVKKFYICLLSK